MTQSRSRRALLGRAVLAALGIIAVLLGSMSFSAGQSASAATGHGTISGGGSTWAEPAVAQWVSNVKSNYQWTINYAGTGSTSGRTQYCQGVYDFGVTDIPYGIANSNEADKCSGRDYVYMPIVAGGTAIMYNLLIGGKRVTNLRLTGETFAKIFTNVITRWNDPEIQAENPALALPNIPIVPVVRSDGSGATAQVTIWMRQMYPQIWDAYCAKVNRPTINGHCGVTSLFPVQPGTAMIAKALDTGTATFTKEPQNVGAITYVEYSYALNMRFPVAKLLNQAGYYTEPTAGHVAVSLLAAQLDNDPNSPTYLTEDLSKVYVDPDPRTYELSSYSYLILPTTTQYQWTDEKGMTLADFGSYLLCEGQRQVDQLGYSALPINLVQAGQEQIKKIPGGDPAVKSIQQCNNPTFSPDGTNKLANTDPQPLACDKAGPTQCTTGTGGAPAVTEPTKQQPAASGATASGHANSAAGGGTGVSSGATASDSDAVGDAGPTDPSAEAPAGYVNAAAKAVVANGTPQSIAKPPPTWTPLIVIVTGLLLLALAMIPAVVRRRRTSAVPAWLAEGQR